MLQEHDLYTGRVLLHRLITLQQQNAIICQKQKNTNEKIKLKSLYQLY